MKSSWYSLFSFDSIFKLLWFLSYLEMMTWMKSGKHKIPRCLGWQTWHHQCHIVMTSFNCRGNTKARVTVHTKEQKYINDIKKGRMWRMRSRRKEEGEHRSCLHFQATALLALQEVTRLMWLACLKTQTYALYMQNGWWSCQRISNWHGGSGGYGEIHLKLKRNLIWEDFTPYNTGKTVVFNIHTVYNWKSLPLESWCKNKTFAILISIIMTKDG